MILVFLVYLGGMLTILSPCILPVLPFVFARAEQPFIKSGLPLLLGMTLTFATIATLAAVGGSWAVNVNQYGRILALAVLAIFGIALLSTRVSDLIARPFVMLGNRLVQPDTSGSTKAGILHSVILGVATGLLWAPCAGPILGLVLTGAVISGPNQQTTLLLFVYAAGAATSLALALLAGGRVFKVLKKSLGAGEWVRKGLGVAVLFAIVAIMAGWDTTVLTQLSLASTNRIEQSLIEKIHPSSAPTQNGSMSMTRDSAMMTREMSGSMSGNNSMMMSGASPHGLPIEGDLPKLDGVTKWLNSPALTKESLQGKVVLIDFWTYSCINCLRALPYVKSWYEKYKDHGLVVIGVHAPEFAFEKDESNVRNAIKELGINYPVAMDNNYAIWQAFNNQYWPAHYFVDATGRIRGHHFGEGKYEESEQTIRELLIEAGVKDLPADDKTPAKAIGVHAAADEANVKSPETYLGHERAKNFVSPESIAADQLKNYTLPSRLDLNQWGLSGKWILDKEKASLNKAPGKIVFRFYARDLHLVLGGGTKSKPIRFKVLIDGVAPGESHGMDIDMDGNGVIREQRLYQLIRQHGSIGTHTFSIEFLDDGAEAFAFTFG